MRRSALLFVFALGACSARVAFPPMEPVKGDPAALLEQYVGEARAATYEQRWIVERHGTEGVFTLYLKVAPPDSMHMVALDDLGSTLCEVTLDRVVSESRYFPGDLGQQILRDLKPFFLPAQGGEYRLVRAEGKLGLYREEDGERELWRRGKVLLTEAEVSVKRWHGDKYPAAMTIRGRYHATVEIREAK